MPEVLATFDELLFSPCALIDLGSAVEFLGDRSINWMTGCDGDWRELAREWKGYSDETKMYIWTKYVSNFHKKANGAGLRLLEQWIVHDQLVLDNAVFNPQFRDMAKVRKLEDLTETPILVPIEIPLEVRMDACRAISEVTGPWATEEACIPFYFADKLAHDGLYNCRDGFPDTFFPSFANSDDSLRRALYYLELSRRGHVPLVISDEKTNQLLKIKEKTNKFLHDIISERVLKSVDFLGSFGENNDEGISAQLPPLQDMILRRSLEHQKSPINIALEIKLSEPAKAYQKKVRELWLSRDADITIKRKAAKEVERLSAKINVFADNPDEGVRFRRRKISLDWIPLAGPMLKAIGSDQIQLNDPIITPANKVDVFLSSWFK
jgi:hypothetical protein